MIGDGEVALRVGVHALPVGDPSLMTVITWLHDNTKVTPNSWLCSTMPLDLSTESSACTAKPGIGRNSH